MSGQLRAAIISGSFPPKMCGIGDYTANLSAALRRRGVSVLNVVPPQYAQPWPAGEAGEETVLGAVEGWSLPHLARLAQTMARLRPDIVHLQYQVSLVQESISVGLLPLLVRRLIPLTRFHVTLHDLHSPYQRYVGRLALRPLVAFSDCVYHSIGSNLPLVARLGWPSRRVVIRQTVVGPGVDVKNSLGLSRAEVREQLGVQPDEFVITCFGIVSPSRDYESLFAAARLLRGQSRPVRVVLVGAGREEDSFAYSVTEIAQIASRYEMKVGREVLLTGRVSGAEIVNIIRGGDATVMPLRDPEDIESRSSFSLLPFCGVPILVSAGRQLPSHIQHAHNVLTFRKGDPAELARELQSLIRDSNLGRSLVAKLPELQQHYSWDAIAKRTETEYRASLARVSRQSGAMFQ
ncbi:MAG: glycosyltransferase family 4 protein [Chloroflexi bacterium]|nr:glycosyltransferase family 4 protein [Chloroflexota bacterium]